MAVKEDIIAEVAEKTEFTKTSVEDMLKVLPEVLVNLLNRDGKVQIPGVVILKAKFKKATTMKNYLEDGGADYKVPERMNVSAKPIKTLAGALKLNKKRI